MGEIRRFELQEKMAVDSRPTKATRSTDKCRNKSISNTHSLNTINAVAGERRNKDG